MNRILPLGILAVLTASCGEARHSPLDRIDAGTADADAPAGDGGPSDGGVDVGIDGGIDEDGGLPEPVSCDWRRVLCLAPPPSCPDGQVPSVTGACWGPCVDLAACEVNVCDGAPLTCGSPPVCPAGHRPFVGPPPTCFVGCVEASTCVEEPFCVAPAAGDELGSSDLQSFANPWWLAFDDDGAYFVGGVFTGRLDLGDRTLGPPPFASFDGFVVAYEPDGAIRWARQIGGNGLHWILGVLPLDDVLIVWGDMGNALDLQIPGPNGPRPPLVPENGTDSFIAGLSLTDGTPLFAQRYDGGSSLGSLIGVHRAPQGRLDVVASVEQDASEDFGCTGVPSTGQLLIARLDPARLVDAPNGALAPGCDRAARFASGSPSASTTNGEGELLVAARAGGMTALGGLPIPFPGDDPGTDPLYVARFDADFVPRWVRGFATRPQPSTPHPSHIDASRLALHDDRLILAGRALGSVDLGGGQLDGVGGGTDWDLFIADVAAATGVVRTATLYPNDGSDDWGAVELDAAGQLHLAGRFSGPGFDWGSAIPPLTGVGEIFAATFDSSGTLVCSLASEGQGAGVRTVTSGAITPDGDELWILGTMGGSIDFGSGAIGSATSSSAMYLQRFSITN